MPIYPISENTNNILAQVGGSATAALLTAHFGMQKYKRQVTKFNSPINTLLACGHREFWRRFLKVGIHELQTARRSTPPTLAQEIIQAAAVSAFIDVSLLRLEVAEKSASSGKHIPKPFRMPMYSMLGGVVAVRAATFGPAFLLLLGKSDQLAKDHLKAMFCPPHLVPWISGTIASTIAGTTGSFLTQPHDMLATLTYNIGNDQAKKVSPQHLISATWKEIVATIKNKPSILTYGLVPRAARFTIVFGAYKLGYGITKEYLEK